MNEYREHYADRSLVIFVLYTRTNNVPVRQRSAHTSRTKRSNGGRNVDLDSGAAHAVIDSIQPNKRQQLVRRHAHVLCQLLVALPWNTAVSSERSVGTPTANHLVHTTP